MVKKGDTFHTYSDELKIQAVKSYLNGEGSQSTIAKKYKLKSRTQLMN
ncbi:transposase [Bacillus cereus]|nr:transposase [Bacillus cereus]MEB8944741.1 transposase [Bacillus cereus]MEB9613435.1 transposase [Bacillus cereus]